MKNKKSFMVSMVIMIIALLIMVINSNFYSFSDWVVRIDGIILILCKPLVTYNTVKLRSSK